MNAKKEIEKRCPRCGEYKAINAENFYYFKSTGRYGDKCIECEKEISREYYKAHKKTLDEKRKKWQAENYEDHIIHCAAYRDRQARKGLVKALSADK